MDNNKIIIIGIVILLVLTWYFIIRFRIKMPCIVMDCTGPCLKHCYNKNTINDKI